MSEVVPVVGYEKQYMVSDDGLVFRITQKGLRKIKPFEDKDGYYRLSLSKNNIRTNVYVHRLVATAFLPNIQNFPCVNHKDENKKNNSATNLEWCSVKYNNLFNGLALRKGKKRRKPIVAVGNGRKFNFGSVGEASKTLNIHRGNISSCLTGARKTAGGMCFYYANELEGQHEKAI